MDVAVPASEGFIPFRGYNVWYRIVGDRKDKAPLLCLHGGPGAPHDYLEPFERMAATGRQVIFYDQLGCGNSDQPHDPSLWTLDLFLGELAVVRKALGLECLHLFGSSWGGMLAMEHALTQPGGIVSLVLEGSPPSAPQLAAEMNRLVSELPAEVLETLLKHEEAGTLDDPAYAEAAKAYDARHVCRLDPWPDCYARTIEKAMRNHEVYFTMWGRTEFRPTGRLKDWSIVQRLNEIRVPTLIISGGYDEVTPACNETLHRGIPGSEWVLFERAAHLVHLEETERFLGVLDQFLSRVERKVERVPGEGS